MESMFMYIVKWYDCDGAGYYETGIEYCGTDRKKALAAKRECDRHSFYGTIQVEVIGRKRQEESDSDDCTD